MPTASPPVAGRLLSTLAVTLGGVTFSSSSDLKVVRLAGVDDLPEVRTADNPRAGADGMDFGTDFYAGRTIEVDVAGRPLDPATTISQLRLALADRASATLGVSGLPGYPALQSIGRVRKRKILDDVGLHYGAIQAFFDFESDDPRMYAATETVLTAGPGAVTSSGITPPLTPPITPGGSAVGGHVQANNIGSASSYPVIRVQGPVTSFSLLNGTTGRSLNFSLALGSSDFVDFDMSAHTVLLGGTASRRNYMTGTWWPLEPGVNDVFYLPSDAAVGSLMTLRFRSAYL